MAAAFYLLLLAHSSHKSKQNVFFLRMKATIDHQNRRFFVILCKKVYIF